MADFRTRILGLVGIAAAFAGLSYGQATCTDGASSVVANPVFVRAEGKTEQVADTIITCDAIAGAKTGQGIAVQLFLAPSVTITSLTVGSGGGAKSETTAYMVQGGAIVAAAGSVQGAVSGNSVTFTFPASAASASGPFQIVVTNIRVDVSGLPAGSGIPTAITEAIFVSGNGVTPAILATQPNVAFVTAGITGIKTTNNTPKDNTVTANTVCADLVNPNFTITFGEGFGNAFKILGTQAANGFNAAAPSPAAWYNNNSETGTSYANGASVNTATSGTRVKIVFNNVPTAGVNLYVPQVIPNVKASGGSMAVTTSETGAFSLAPLSTAKDAPAGTVGVTISNGSATVVYEYGQNAAGAVASDGSTESFAVNVTLSGKANTFVPQAATMTGTVSFAPIGAAAGTVPNFVSGASTATLNVATFSACTTTLLFPYVTNTLGFDTGLAIANASNDTLNGGKSSAANQAGTCVITFFGTNAPAAAVTTANVATGTSYISNLSSIAPGFQGYMIANCNFLFGHGFAYISYNLGQASGVSMGYLADTIGTGRAATTALPEATNN